jgi:hypothetical protein
MKRSDHKYVGGVQAAKIMLMLLVLALAGLPGNIYGQADSTETTETEEPSLISPAVEFTSIQKADNSVVLKANFRAKIKGTLTKLSGLNAEFFAIADTAEVKLGESITNKAGLAEWKAAENTLIRDNTGSLNFKVVFDGNKTIEAVEELLAIKKAKLVMTPVKADSLYTVELKLIDLSTGLEVPVPETNISVYVQRLFSPLKLGEGTTDENGDVTVEIPGNLSGDAKGNLTLLARVDENEVYGVVEASSAQQWGSPVSEEFQKMPRALWSSQPPMWMLITFIILMATVWGHYIVIIYELFRLRKEHS